MSTYFKDWIFNQLPKYYQKNDTYPDVNGEGVLKRYLRVFGTELDEQYTPYIDNFLNIIDYLQCDDKFLPLIGSILGYPPSVDGLPSTYRKILANIIAIYKVKGTIQSFEMLFNLLGLEITIIEEEPKKAVKYDGIGKYDNDPVNIYDSHCDYCSGYWIIYNSKYDTTDPFVHNEVDTPLLTTVQNIICFLNPINAVFKGMIPGYKVADSFTLNMNDAVNICSIPLNVVVAYNPSNSSATITWQGAGTFQMQYRLYPNGDFSNIIEASSGDVILGLTTNSIYEIQIRRQCDVDSFSEWVSSLLFTGDGILNSTDHNLSLRSISLISNSPAITLLGDYSLYIDFTNPISVLAILINNTWILGNNTQFNTADALTNWLNTLGYGAFTLGDKTIYSLGNTNTISEISFNQNNINWSVLFSQTNKRLLNPGDITLLGDYSLEMEYPLNVVSITIGDITTAGPGNIADDTSFLAWLNSLGKGQFNKVDNLITTVENPNVFNKITFTTDDDTNERDLIFTQTNLKLLDTTNNTLITNYSVFIDFSKSIKVDSILINGVEIAGNGNFFASSTELILWLNTLGKGTFELKDDNIISNKNPNVVSTITYEINGDATQYKVNFSQRDNLIINLSGQVSTIQLNDTNILSDGTYAQSIAPGQYDQITIELTPGSLPITGGILITDNNTGPYYGFMDNGNLVFINVTLGDLFQLKLT